MKHHGCIWIIDNLLQCFIVSHFISQIFQFARGSTRHTSNGQELAAIAVCLNSNKVKAIPVKTVTDVKRAIITGSIAGKLQASRHFLKRDI